MLSAVWLGLVLLFLAIEAGTVAMVSLWFALGAAAALIAAALGTALWVQLALFAAVSGALLALARPLIKRYVSPHITRTNVDGLIGTEGIVSAEIDNLRVCGQVRLGAMPWTARSATGEPIAAGTLVRVERIEGAKAIVRPVSVPAAAGADKKEE